MRALVIAAVVGGLATAALAQPAPDKANAKELYQSAEAAMAAQDYVTAARDYGAAYEISHDAVLFYKIGTANERAGKCPVAVIYYRRYLAEAKPTPAFIDITNARIKACEPTAVDTPPVPPVEKPVEQPVEKPVEKPAEKPSETPTEPAKDDAKTAMGAFVGSRDTGSHAPALTSRNRTAWLFVTGSIALVTVGAVLAYSADSAENDIADLYVGLSGNPPVFDRETKALYEDMIAEGHRYERLSWISFGLAGATAGAAAYLFWREHQRSEHAKPLTVTPTVSKDGAGVNAVIRF
jgi:hypothetical protein